jgi:haloalkane dehalogenase
MVSGAMQYKKKVQPVMDKQIAYIVKGEGDPIVLLDGNRTSSCLWRSYP